MTSGFGKAQISALCLVSRRCDVLKVRLAAENKARLDLYALPKPLCPKEKDSFWIPACAGMTQIGVQLQ